MLKAEVKMAEEKRPNNQMAEWLKGRKLQIRAKFLKL
jgi:hypothetical protein